MRRILLDFSLTAEDAQARLRRQIPDLTPAEFAAWDAAGLLEHRVIDGRTLYFNRAPSNLFRLSEAAVKRRSSATPPWTDGPMETANAHHREVRDQALATGKHGVAPRQRAGDVFADRESGCRAERRDAARLAAVSARAPGSAGKRAPRREHAGRTRHRAGVGSAAHRLPRAARRSRQADDVFDHVRADRLRPVPRDRSREGRGRRRARRSSRPTWRSARHTSCSLPRSASSPARSSARKPIRTGSRKSCSPRSIAFRGPARANIPRSPTSATTRCTPATRIAGSRRCC